MEGYMWGESWYCCCRRAQTDRWRAPKLLGRKFINQAGSDSVYLLGSKVDHPSEEQKDTHDNVSHIARFIFSQLGSGYPPDTVGFNTDPEYKIQAAFIFF
jgi:hypothetical protein